MVLGTSSLEGVCNTIFTGRAQDVPRKTPTGCVNLPTYTTLPNRRDPTTHTNTTARQGFYPHCAAPPLSLPPSLNHRKTRNL